MTVRQSNNLDQTELSQQLKAWCKDAGFHLAGIAPATPRIGSDRLRQWLAQGKHGQMDYMQRNLPARENPELLLPNAKSVLIVALSYRTVPPAPAQPGQGKISRYAWGEDYHRVLKRKLKRVVANLRTLAPDIRTRIAVDSAPIMERDYAQLAGLGWFGKNTLLLNKHLGSWFFLGVVLFDCELEYDEPTQTDHCGTCRKCLDACPTQAFDGPYQLDPRRCISYITIEHKTAIPNELADRMDGWIFGCDVCQDVCPWNTHTQRDPVPAPQEFHPAPARNPAPLAPILQLDEEEFDIQYRHSPIHRIGRERWIRNAQLAVSNPTPSPDRQLHHRPGTDSPPSANHSEPAPDHKPLPPVPRDPDALS